MNSMRNLKDKLVRKADSQSCKIRTGICGKVFAVIFFVFFACICGKLFVMWYIGNLPKYNTSPDYPKLTIAEMKEKAEYIVYGKVKQVKGRDALSILKDKVQKDTNQMAKTPVVIEVKRVLKGEVKGSTVTYYQDGGLQYNAMILPAGFSLAKGDEIVLFMDESQNGWGYYGEFPVVDGQVYGVLQEDLKLFLNLQTKEARNIDAEVIQTYLSQKGVSSSEKFQTIELEEFLEYLE